MWRKARKSGGGNCIEVAALPDGRIAIRDSKNPRQMNAVQFYTAAEFDAFRDGIKRGEFDDL
jgi:hypothetical protein